MGGGDKKIVQCQADLFHFSFQSRYLPLAPGQKVFHLPLIEGLGWSAGQRGKRDHPGVGEGLCT